jgi:beta-1,2-mannobiose phosphorylase / 1,2-beta-oligomannan phosphorylase
LEDPRIVHIDGTYYLTYTAYDGTNAMGALALSQDLRSFEKYGLIVPKITYKEFSRLAESKGQLNEKYLRYNDHGRLLNNKAKPPYVWDKNVIFFPRRIGGKLFFLHRIRPDIQVVSVYELTELTIEFWQNYFIHLDEHIVLSSRYKHEISYIGGGCPPIETEDGWLLIYHSVHDTIDGYVYSACAALFDIDNPQRILARLPYPLFKPELNWELSGYVNNVCFPTGSILEGDKLFIYYGAADEQIACASLSITELLKELKQYKEN